MAEAPAPVRAVLDTNVWISGIFFRRGTPANILAAWRDDRFEVVMTQQTLAELAARLASKAAQFGAPADLAGEWLTYIDVYARKVTASGRVTNVSRDPADDIFLDAAVSGDAAYLVTGDKDLLVLDKYQGVRILSPRDFLTILDSVAAE